MFCDHCGTPLQPDFNVCPKCGRPLVRATGVAPSPARMEHHLHTLGIIWIVLSALWMIPSFFLMTMGHAVPFMFSTSPRHVFGNAFLPPLMFGLGSGFLLVSLAGICVGWGLMRHEPWARIVAIILAILVILHPPFGTLLGIYTLWVLLSHNTDAYERG